MFDLVALDIGQLGQLFGHLAIGPLAAPSPRSIRTQGKGDAQDAGQPEITLYLAQVRLHVLAGVPLEQPVMLFSSSAMFSSTPRLCSSSSRPASRV